MLLRLVFSTGQQNGVCMALQGGGEHQRASDNNFTEWLWITEPELKHAEQFLPRDPVSAYCRFSHAPQPRFSHHHPLVVELGELHTKRGHLVYISDNC